MLLPSALPLQLRLTREHDLLMASTSELTLAHQQLQQQASVNKPMLVPWSASTGLPWLLAMTAQTLGLLSEPEKRVSRRSLDRCLWRPDLLLQLAARDQQEQRVQCCLRLMPTLLLPVQVTILTAETEGQGAEIAGLSSSQAGLLQQLNDAETAAEGLQAQLQAARASAERAGAKLQARKAKTAELQVGCPGLLSGTACTSLLLQPQPAGRNSNGSRAAAFKCLLTRCAHTTSSPLQPWP